MTAYQGHRSWNAWNVSLYIANEEHLYFPAVRALRATYNLRQATNRFLQLTGVQGTKTPDGAVYNYGSVCKALAGLEIEQRKD